MEQFIEKKFSNGLLLLLILSTSASMAYTRIVTIPTENDCPKDLKEWGQFVIKINNVKAYLVCFDDLKKDFLDNKEYEKMNMEQMHETLLNGYEKLIDFYYDGNTGDDENLAHDYENERAGMEKKKPKKSKN